MELDPVGLAAFQSIVLAVMLFGLIGLAIPVLPGLVIIWVPALVYGVVTGFNWANGLLFAMMTVLMIAGSLVDNVIMGARARQHGASWVAITVALVAGLVGSVLMPPFGGLIAALLGLFAVEYYRLKNWRTAAASTRSMAIGCGWAAVIRFGIGVVMILLWIAWALWI
jgi:uncharacterized protein